MKFTQYINEYWPGIPLTQKETEELQNIIMILKRDCSQFIKEYETASTQSKVVSRYSKSFIDTPIVKITPRQNRHPMDTPLWLHDYLDGLFEKKFGWKPRSTGVFAIGTVRKDTTGSSSFKLIFPVDGYKYLWNPEIADLFVYIRDFVEDELKTDLDYNSQGDDWFGMTAKDTVKFRNRINTIVDGYQDKGFIDGKLGIEVAISCKAYYAVDIGYIKALFIDGMLFK